MIMESSVSKKKSKDSTSCWDGCIWDLLVLPLLLFIVSPHFLLLVLAVIIMLTMLGQAKRRGLTLRDLWTKRGMLGLLLLALVAGSTVAFMYGLTLDVMSRSQEADKAYWAGLAMIAM